MPADHIVALVSRAVASRELMIEDPMAMRLMAQAIVALARAGQCDLAERQARDMCVVATRLGLESVDAEFSATLAMVRSMQGALVDAERLARRSLALTEGRPFARRPMVVAYLAKVLVTQGRFDEAEELLDIHQRDETTRCGVEGPVLLELRGWLQVLQGRPIPGLATLFRAGRLAAETGIENPAVSSWRSRAVAALKDLGRDDEAVALADENLQRARAFGAPWAIGEALRDLSTVAPGSERLALLEEAEPLLASSAAVLSHALVLIELGSARFDSGASSHSARAAIRQGAEMAWRSGALQMIAQAERELRRTGAKPRRIALTGADSLTPSEVRVTILAAGGKGNADIARELVLSQKTVEGHLSRAYRKLGVRSRTELAAAVMSDHGPQTTRLFSQAL